MAFTGLAFDPNHVSGDYDFSLLTVTEIVLLLRSTGAVMIFTTENNRNSDVEAPRLQTRSFGASRTWKESDR